MRLPLPAVAFFRARRPNRELTQRSPSLGSTFPGFFVFWARKRRTHSAKRNVREKTMLQRKPESLEARRELRRSTIRRIATRLDAVNPDAASVRTAALRMVRTYLLVGACCRPSHCCRAA